MRHGKAGALRDRFIGVVRKGHPLSRGKVTLARGYGVARRPDGGALPSAADFTAGLAFDLQLRDGMITARTETVTLRGATAPTGNAA